MSLRCERALRGREQASWGVCYRNLAREGHEMVFAEAGDVDVLDDDHFIMILGKNCIVDDV